MLCKANTRPLILVFFRELLFKKAHQFGFVSVCEWVGTYLSIWCVKLYETVLCQQTCCVKLLNQLNKTLVLGLLTHSRTFQPSTWPHDAAEDVIVSTNLEDTNLVTRNLSPDQSWPKLLRNSCWKSNLGPPCQIWASCQLRQRRKMLIITYYSSLSVYSFHL